MSDHYIAGTCNIGKSEIRQRQIVALIGLALSISALIGFITTQASPSVRLGIFLPLAIFSIGWVKVSRVADKASLAADRKTAVSVLMQSLGLAAILTLIVYLLPLK